MSIVLSAVMLSVIILSVIKSPEQYFSFFASSVRNELQIQPFFSNFFSWLPDEQNSVRFGKKGRTTNGGKDEFF
jgi:hypothetical protein